MLVGLLISTTSPLWGEGWGERGLNDYDQTTEKQSHRDTKAQRKEKYSYVSLCLCVTIFLEIYSLTPMPSRGEIYRLSPGNWQEISVVLYYRGFQLCATDVKNSPSPLYKRGSGL